VCHLHSTVFCITRFDSPAGADPCDGGAGEGLHGEGHVWALPLGANPPQVPGSEEDREGLPSLQQVRQFTLQAIFGKKFYYKKPSASIEQLRI